MEWHLELPLHHYVHVVSGIIEFATLTVAAIVARRRTRHAGTIESRAYAAVVTSLLVGYPLLALVYLTDRLGTLVEPLFFLTFSAMVVTELFEPTGRRSSSGRPRRATDRSCERSTREAAPVDPETASDHPGQVPATNRWIEA